VPLCLRPPCRGSRTREAMPRDRVGRHGLEATFEIGARLRYRSDQEILDFPICAIYVKE